MILRCEGRELVFIDVEASSLGAGSFPVEIGWVLDDEATDSVLVRPHHTWNTRGGWSATSQKLHGITLERLQAEGMDASEICDRLDSVCNDRRPVSDNAAFDEYWVAMLYAATRRTRGWSIQSLDEAFSVLAQTGGVGAIELYKAFIAVDRRWPHPHRAAPDAQRMAKKTRALADVEFRRRLLTI